MTADSTPCPHAWTVYSTAVATGHIMVRCDLCRRLGSIEPCTYTEAEWRAAFHAPGKPYRWEDNERVVVEGSPEWLGVGKPPDPSDLCCRIEVYELALAANPPDPAAVSRAGTRLHYALTHLPDVPGDPTATPLVVVDGVVYGAKGDGAVMRGRVVATYETSGG